VAEPGRLLTPPRLSLSLGQACSSTGPHA
jgi:hypothetical protein